MADDNNNPAPEPAPEPTPTPTVGDGPWAQDLAAAFEDEAVRTQVDGFLREKIQPHVTQLEKARADAKIAEELYSDLQSKPVDTYLEVTEELFGEDYAKNVRAAIEQDQVPSDDDDFDLDAWIEENNNENSSQPASRGLDPRVEALIQEAEQAKQQKAYDTAIAAVKAEHPDLNEQLFDPFVYSANGDFEKAYEAYSQFVDQFKPANEGDEPPEPAPQVVGSDAGGGTPPPTGKKYANIGEAIEDFVQTRGEPDLPKLRKSAPSTVGS